MGELVAVEFVTLDGVMQGFHVRDEREGFRHSGWGAEYADDVQFRSALEHLPNTAAYLFGRRTYEELSKFWPEQPSANPMAAHLNETPKYVATSTLETLPWSNSHALGGDLRDAVNKLKQQVPGAIVTLGSQHLTDALIAAELVDAFRLFIHPLVLGSGRRLFGPGRNLRLQLGEVERTTTDVLMLSYRVLH